MNYQALFEARRSSGIPTRAALIGVGQFGRTLLMQSMRIAQLDLSVLCDTDVGRMVAACRSAGLPDDAFVVVENRKAMLTALEAGRTALTPDAWLAVDAPVDVVVEATGNAEAGAVNCNAAIEHGRHIVLVTKETDSVIGPLLAHRARAQGLVISQVDGDQPSLLLALISWAKMLGLEIACAGKASEFDFVFDPATATVTAEGLESSAPLDPALWQSSGRSYADVIAMRSDALGAIPQRTPPDYCEMCLVANASGLKPDRPEFHAPIARPTELADIFRADSLGGVLRGENRLDIFNCFRRPDEISFAGGVFAVLPVPDRETGELFRSKGIPVSSDGSHVLVYNPTHLLGVEAPMSILAAHRLGMSTGGSYIQPVCDMIMRATKDLTAGTLLHDTGLHHRIDGIEALLVEHQGSADQGILPYFMGIGLRLSRNVPKGAILTKDHIDVPVDSRLWALRQEQDRILKTKPA